MFCMSVIVQRAECDHLNMSTNSVACPPMEEPYSPLPSPRASLQREKRVEEMGQDTKS